MWSLTLARTCVSIVLILGASAGAPLLASPITFTALPGNIEGAPGGTTGWGYALTNLSVTDWLLPTALNADAFAHATPTALFDFPALAPGASLVVDYDGPAFVGLFELTWDQDAPPGFVNAGAFVMDAEWWDADPLDPFAGANYLGPALAVSADYSASVAAAPAVPEPAAIALLMLGVGARSLRRRRTSTARRM
jgi:hypothetical protein